MNRTFLTLLLVSMLASTSAAQVFAGDSLRLRDTRDMSWHYGRLLNQDGTSFSLGRATDTLRVSIVDLQRVDRWQRNGRNLVWVTAAVGMLGATLAYYLTPEEEQRTGGGCVITVGVSSVCTTITTRTRPGNLRTMQALGTAGGAAMGFVGLAVWPGQWKIVLSR